MNRLCVGVSRLSPKARINFLPLFTTSVVIVGRQGLWEVGQKPFESGRAVHFDCVKDRL